MASQERPGIEIVQELQETPTVTAAPTLVPVVIGVCNQIIDELDDEGALNPDAKYSVEQYNQASLLITQAEFPDPRSNIDEINVYEDTVGAALFFGGQLYNLERGSHSSSGNAYLESKNLSTRAALRSTIADSFAFDATVGDAFTFAFDVVNPTDTSKDVTVTLLGTLTTAELVEEINDAVGADVASVFTDTGDDFGGGPTAKYLHLESQTWGATSSITLRQGTSALKVLFGASFDDAQGYRVVSAGFQGQDDADGDLFTPWIEFSRGGYFEDGGTGTYVDTPFHAVGTANEVWPGLVDLDGTFTEAKAAAEIFLGSSATVPLVQATAAVPGDQFWADGVQVGSAEIIKLEQSRFKLGRLNTSLSTFDDNGDATTRVYDTIEVNTLNHGDAFSPRYAYFVAHGLVWGDITPAGVAAAITGTGGAGSVTEARAAIVQSTIDITFPVNLASLTIIHEVVEDGVSNGEVVYTFTLGPFANIAALLAAITVDFAAAGITASNAGDRLVLSTTKTGANQSITIKASGTANTALEFSATTATADTGKDAEYTELATVIGGYINLPMTSASSVNLDIEIVDSKGIHTLTAVAVALHADANMGDLIEGICDALNPSAGLGPDLYNGGIKVATITSSGAAGDAFGTLTIASVEGGTVSSIDITAAVFTDGFRHFGFYDAVGGMWSEVESTGALSFPVAALSGLNLDVTYTDVGGPYPNLSAVLGALEASAASASALAVLLNSNPDLNGTNDVGSRIVWWFGDDVTDTIICRSILGLATTTVTPDVSGGSAGLALLLPAGAAAGAAGDNATDDGADILKTTTLSFFLDENPYQYDVTFTTNSLTDAVNEVNETVGGAADVASESAGLMTITSQLKGSASKVEMDDSSTAAVVLGLSGSTLGSGRPDPNFYLNGSGSLIIGPSILRNSTTGIPFSLESATADLYIAYHGLRLDVTAAANAASLLSLGNTQIIEDAIGPISTDNPLALGAFLANINAPDVDVSALGLDERNDAAPTGTLTSWAKALEFMESREAYTLAPLTGDEYVIGMIATHVRSMSLPTNRGERICFLWAPPPTTHPAVTAGSGTDAEANGVDDSVTLESNMSDEVIGQGITDLSSIDVDEGLYLELLIVSGGVTELSRYSVQVVNGVVLNFRTTFAAGENDDGYYSTTTFDGSSGFDNMDWSLKVRGAKLLIAGTSITDLNQVAAAAAAESESYAHRRVFYLYADSIDVSVDGITQRVPTYYASAVIAGMVAQLEPQMPFTNVPMLGIGQVYGTDDTFSENQMDVIADGGRYLLTNQGGNVASRHSRSTSTTSIEARELSITKSIDWLSKGLRETNRVFIGRYVITQGFLDQLTMANQGFLDYAEQLKVVKQAELLNILQDEDEPDTILIDVEAAPQYPSNKIRLTIVA